jgi:hydroxyacylglutathione hydrolase
MANIRFAVAVEPRNAALQARKSREAAKRASGQPTLPTTIADELATNPFLRWDSPDVIAAAEGHAGRTLPNAVDVFATVREWKNAS